MAKAEEICQAIITLYNTQDAKLRGKANEYLIDFVGDNGAWGVAIELLSSTDVTQVQYFAANILYTKVSRDWIQLQENGRTNNALVAHLSNSLLKFLKDRISSSSSNATTHLSTDDNLVLLRVCLALSALAIKLPDGCTIVLHEAFQFLGGSPEGVGSISMSSSLVGLAMIQALPQEIERVDMSRNRRKELLETLKASCPQILQVIQAVVVRRGEEWPCVKAALDTLESWSGPELISLEHLHSLTPALYEFLSAVISSCSGPPPTQELFLMTCQVLSKVSSSSASPATQYLFESILRGVHQGKVMSWLGDDARCAFTALIVEVSTREAEVLARAEQGYSLPMIEILLALTNHENNNVSSMSLEFWETLAEVPLVERDGRLGLPLYEQLVHVLMGRLSFPTSWGEENEEEELWSYREAELMRETLESCCAFLRAKYFLKLRELQQALTGSQTWQSQEVLLFMTHTVSRATMSHLESATVVVPTDNNDRLSEDGCITAQVLVEFMQQYTSEPTLYTQHHLLLKAVLRVVGAYQRLLIPRNSKVAIVPAAGALLGQDESIAIHRRALQAVVAGLQHPLVGETAALTLRSLCVGTEALGIMYKDPHSLEIVMACLHYASVSYKQPISTRLLVVEAIVRTVLAMHKENDREKCRSLLNRFVSPILGSLTHSLHSLEEGGQGVSNMVWQSIGEDLQLLGQIVRFADVGEATLSSEPHVAEDIVREMCPQIERLALVLHKLCSFSHQMHVIEEVLDHLFPLCRHLIVGLRSLMIPYLPTLLATIVGLYSVTFHPGALETTGQVVEMFREEEGGGAAAAINNALLAELFTTVVSQTLMYIAEGGRHPAPGECPELVGAFFDMLLRFCCFRPSVVFNGDLSQISTILEFSILCLQQSQAEKESLRSVLRTLRELMKYIESHPRETGSYWAMIREGERAQRLTSLCIAGLAGKDPVSNVVWVNYFEFFYSFIQVWPMLVVGRQAPQTTYAWIQRAVYEAEVLPTGSSEDRELVSQLISRFAGENNKKQRLKLLLDDIAKMSRSEVDVEALKSYQL